MDVEETPRTPHPFSTARHEEGELSGSERSHQQRDVRSFPQSPTGHQAGSREEERERQTASVAGHISQVLCALDQIEATGLDQRRVRPPGIEVQLAKCKERGDRSEGDGRALRTVNER